MKNVASWNHWALDVTENNWKCNDYIEYIIAKRQKYLWNVFVLTNWANWTMRGALKICAILLLFIDAYILDLCAVRCCRCRAGFEPSEDYPHLAWGHHSNPPKLAPRFPWARRANSQSKDQVKILNSDRLIIPLKIYNCYINKKIEMV